MKRVVRGKQTGEGAGGGGNREEAGEGEEGPHWEIKCRIELYNKIKQN